MKYIFLMVFSAAVLFSDAVWAGKRKVLLIGIDGVRADALQAARVPTIQWLFKNGFGTFESWHQDITISGPSWSSILCGVYHDKHGVTDNGFHGKRYDRYPMIPLIAKAYDPQLTFGMYMEWGKLYRNSVGQGWDQMLRGSLAATEETARKSAQWIASTDLDFYFVYFGAADYVGHVSGFSRWNPFYRWSLQDIDSGVNEVLRGMRSREQYENEDWLVLLTTDHGGKLLGHGGLSKSERQVFWIGYSDRIQRNALCGMDGGNINDPLNPPVFCIRQHSPVQTDIAITALHHLLYGTLCEESDLHCWNFDGVSWLDHMGMCNERADVREIAYAPMRDDFCN
ncbi:MAG: alkaline phosphatase family protein [Saprospiraceae bacterium]|nr:alkaline phosphatase family protein [Saprospiraceae bacterium]